MTARFTPEREMAALDRDSKVIVGLFVLALVPLGAILRGVVLAKLWEWFVADQFGLVHLSVVQAIGIAVTYGVLTGARSEPPSHEAEYRDLPSLRLLCRVIGTQLGTAFVLLIGLVVVQFA